MASALCTERLGIHLLFGSFLMGAIMPKEPRFVQYIVDRFETITVTLLLPLFFAFTGLRTNVALLKGPGMWFYCGLIILVAAVGKLGGSMAAARLGGMGWREAAGLGTVAIACAAVDDVTGWCILAYIVVLIRAAHQTTSIWVTLGGILLFAAVMIYGVRFLLRGLERTFHKYGEISENRMAFLLLLAMVSALCTERLGIHLLFGSFLMGAIMPKEPRFVQYIVDRFETITVTLLLPLFFAFTGLRTNIGLLKGPAMWFYCALIILVAAAGKLGGSMAAARMSGMEWREAAGLGTLMNTRGLMGLVILDIGLDIKIISPALFTMMVVMALATTFMAVPLLDLIGVDSEQRTEKKTGQADVSLHEIA
jgi:Kef-type K+ transport system membrane component KefB